MARGVPYLQLDAFAVKLDCSNLEVNADGCDEGGSEGVFTEAQQAARLSNAGVADEEQFDLKVRSASGRRGCRVREYARPSWAYQKVIIP